MPTPFSMLGAPSAKPTAVGEAGYHLPMMPLLSGQDAVDSLVGYYPKRRMDSKLNPHTYQNPTTVRSTTMPNTKTAEKLWRGYATIKLASLDLTKSDLVRGFIGKCAAADLDPQATYDAVVDAMQLHPTVAEEFEKCGMEKKAIGSGNGLFLPGVTPGNNTGFVNSPKAPATPPPKLTSSPMSSPSRAALLTGSWKKPPVAAKPSTPAPTPTPSPPTQQQYPPNYVPPPDRNVLGQGFTNSGNVLKGGVTSLAGGLGTVGGFLGQAVGHSTDWLGMTDGWGESADNFTSQMMDNTHSGVGTAWAGVTNDDPQLVAWRMRQGGYTNAKPVDQMRQDHLRQLHEGNGVDLPFIGHISPETAGGTYNLMTEVGDEAAKLALLRGAKNFPGIGKVPGLSPAVNTVSNFGQSHTLWTGLPGEMLGTGGNVAINSPSVAAIPRDTLRNTPTFQSGTIHPDAINMGGWDPKTGEPNAQLGSGRVVPLTDIDPTTGRAPRTAPDGRPALPEVPSVLTGVPAFSEMKDFVAQAPEQAKGFLDQAVGQIKDFFNNPDTQSEIAGAMKTGQLGPAGERGALTALTQEGFDWDTATQLYGKMSLPEKIGLWGGVGIAGIGLINAMAGGNGLASILMTLLGLGTTGFSAGMGGLLDQGSKDFTQGVSNAVTGPETQQLPDMVKSHLPKVLQLPDAALLPMLQQLPSMSPDVAKQLDQAAGVGSWGNSALGWFGDVTGMRQNKMQQALGLNPEQQDRLLRLWTQMRGQ
jgi:hypothetical protein